MLSLFSDGPLPWLVLTSPWASLGIPSRAHPAHAAGCALGPAGRAGQECWAPPHGPSLTAQHFYTQPCSLGHQGCWVLLLFQLPSSFLADPVGPTTNLCLNDPSVQWQSSTLWDFLPLLPFLNTRLPSAFQLWSLCRHCLKCCTEKSRIGTSCSDSSGKSDTTN